MKNHLMLNQSCSEITTRIPEEQFAQWEQRTGYKLPDDYRRFMLKYNGGVIKPWLFKHHHPEIIDEDYAILDGLFDWDYVLKYSEIEVPQHLRNRPPHHIDIGFNPGGGCILLSLAKNNYGQVVYWLPVHLEWGDEYNNVIGIIANSFTEFLDRLYDDGETRNTIWENNAKKRTPVELTF